MDVIDDPSCQRIVATFEIPGVKCDEVNLHVKEGSLVVEGQRRPRYSPQATIRPENASRSLKGGHHEHTSSLPNVPSGKHIQKLRVPVQELRYGRFRRLVNLPSGTKVSLAHYQHTHTKEAT
jgi:HSP20 family molecular chaperone IbpA